MNEDLFAASKDGFKHLPVLYREVLEHLTFDGPCRIIDGTLGCGGHSSLILKSNPQAELLGIDRDGDALERAKENLRFAERRIQMVRGNFSELVNSAKEIGWESVDGILLDVGVSSPQIDDSKRGFSLRLDGPLDMRMDNRSQVTASRILNYRGEAEVADIFYYYGLDSRSLDHKFISDTRDWFSDWLMLFTLKNVN